MDNCWHSAAQVCEVLWRSEDPGLRYCCDSRPESWERRGWRAGRWARWPACYCSGPERTDTWGWWMPRGTRVSVGTRTGWDVGAVAWTRMQRLRVESCYCETSQELTAPGSRQHLSPPEPCSAENKDSITPSCMHCPWPQGQHLYYFSSIAHFNMNFKMGLAIPIIIKNMGNALLCGDLISGKPTNNFLTRLESSLTICSRLVAANSPDPSSTILLCPRSKLIKFIRWSNTPTLDNSKLLWFQN